MEIVTLLLIVIILVALLNFKSDISSRLDHLQNEIIDLKSKRFKPQSVQEEKLIVQQQKSIEVNPLPPKPVSDNWESGFKVMQEPERTWEKITPAPKKQEAPIVQSTIKVSLDEQQPIFSPPPPRPSFFERNPDLEKFIGENLVSKIGIGILVLAIGFFVKYAIDNNWIGEVGRVCIGLLCGGILVGLAHKLRNSYKSFSSVLIGGGMAVFYFTITLAYHNFHLLGQTASFIILIAITAFAVALSLLYDRQELAIISLVGGFLSPFLVSDGRGHYQTLFVYLIILNTGLLVMAYHKAWRLLNLLAFIFTVIIFGGWLLTNDDAAITYRNGFVYASIFYLLFFAINIANNIKESKKFIASDFGILLANTALYFGAGLYCILNMHADQYKGIFSAGMGIFNLAASYLLFRNRKVDTNILYLLVGLTLTFVSLTAPLQLHGNYITLFWASETVLLYWLYQKSRIAIIQFSSGIIWMAMLISLLMDWGNVYGNTNLYIPIIFNKGFITTFYVSLATYLLFMLIKKQENKNAAFLIIMARTASLVLLFLGGAFELHYQFQHYYPDAQFDKLYLLLYLVLFANIVLLVSKKHQWLLLNEEIHTALLVICLVFYFITLPITYSIQYEILTTGKNGGLFMAHWVTALLIANILFMAAKAVIDTKAHLKQSGIFTWLTCALVVAYLSVEFHLLGNALFCSKTSTWEEIERVYIKTALPILWGLCSFAFMWMGMKYKYRTLRIVSLSLFCLTLLKLFIFDITNIPIAGKIAAFFCLGVLLLVVSFMYQRLKKIISDDEKKVDA